MSAPKFVIYALADPRDGSIRYVGKSVNGRARATAHGAPSALAKDRTHKANWIRSMLAVGVKYEIGILEQFTDGSALADAEIRWIAHGRAMGWPLTNLTDGGDGSPGHRVSEEVKVELRRRVFTPEWRERIAAAKRGVKFTDEHRAAIAAARRRAPRKPKQLKLRLSGKGMPPAPTTREKLSRALVGNKNGVRQSRVSEEHKRALANARSSRYYYLHLAPSRVSLRVNLIGAA